MSENLYQELKTLEGTESDPRPANDRVNEAMIRHWCEAMQDANPLYSSREYAEAGPYKGVIAPPTMIQAYCTPPLWPQAEAGPDPIFRAALSASISRTGAGRRDSSGTWNTAWAPRSIRMTP